ncbi:MAG TPA: Coenzyme F420 hydrogenase/dehydrogenase, beta subunit C-terminal domain [Methanoregulaceae archaeon]|nr:Coenzyme F420 hydrogenase/dehydrogenase, beta subunit C-terminal domain [Methanoregulaceae archaeon]HPW10726.1 Coenzyme F420 hydrogenase/dehydrogenase, beta subunit C-terminal domain [Methanoregulaceae archaeon]HQM56086.1 Coenzyme F420 hydrogenase/dehydrogenase, beta subunit C-terminal domain [Methanoregulaceae archaeon]
MALFGGKAEAKKGDMLYAWTNDADLAKKAECGGAVTELLKYALESKTVDAVLAVKRGVDLYDAVPTIVTNPKDLDACAGSLHCGTLLLSKLVMEYVPKLSGKKLGMVVKGCDLMGLLELSKRKLVNLDNIVMIGVNCGGSVSPVTARKMIKEKFGVDPNTVTKEEIDKGQFIIEYEGGHKGISMDELEEAGYGRRSNCRRCKLKVPRQADLACGNWGVIGDKAGKATFVEVCSDKGAKLLNAAVKANKLTAEPANQKGIELRTKVENSMYKLGDKWRKHDFEALAPNLWETIAKETGRCMKCYACIDHCPVCVTIADKWKQPDQMVRAGFIPADPMFHLRRFAHISDSCINCGQCEEGCPSEIPLALFSHAIRTEADKFFEPKLGKPAYTN